jgi:hypothetical protein
MSTSFSIILSNVRIRWFIMLLLLLFEKCDTSTCISTSTTASTATIKLPTSLSAAATTIWLASATTVRSAIDHPLILRTVTKSIPFIGSKVTGRIRYINAVGPSATMITSTTIAKFSLTITILSHFLKHHPCQGIMLMVPTAFVIVFKSRDLTFGATIVRRIPSWKEARDRTCHHRASALEVRWMCR